MTEINFAEPTKNKMRIRRTRQHSATFGIRIDMTPMVDLGFLLITFFVFTTEMSKPAAMKLYMPHDGIPTPMPASKSLTILLNGSNKLFYYFGDEETAMKDKRLSQTSYDELTGLGKVIRQKQMELEKNAVDRKELIILIKPTIESSYKNLVATLDEMLINDVSRYAITDPDKEESALVKQHK
jgi:biopolymer transport protein ExbD